MKISATCVLFSTLLLSSCAQFAGMNYDKHMDDGRDGPAGEGGAVDFGPVTAYENIELDERELTDEIVSVLGVENLATVIAYDFLGNAIAFDRVGKSYDGVAKYPVDASQLARPYTVTLIPFEGSHCIDRIDSLGRARRICTPPH